MINLTITFLLMNSPFKLKILETENVSVGKPAHKPKIHVWAGIFCNGPTKLVIFERNLKNLGFQNIRVFYNA